MADVAGNRRIATRFRVVRLLALGVTLGLAGSQRAHAAEPCDPPVARVVSVQGTVELRRGSTAWVAVTLNASLCAGDNLRVLPYGRAALLLSNETTVRLDQGTSLTLGPANATRTTLLDQLSGRMHVITRTPRAFNVKTPFVNANIEGTEFLVRVTQASASIAVYEGHVVAANDLGSVALESGEEAVATANSAPRKELVVRPRDAVAWTLYFPAILDSALGTETASLSTDTSLQRSMELYRAGKVSDALAELDRVPGGNVTARLLTFRAGLLLLLGRLDEARPEIDKALRLDPRLGDAYALLATIAVVENDKDKASGMADKAISLAPTSPAGLIARSYASQARFRIDDALSSGREAVRLAPTNALAWARLAELEMSVGALGRGLDAAKRAAAIDPALAKTQTVLGFASLIGGDVRAAGASFEKAIVLDQNDPAPRLGLGLARIRSGDLIAGRKEIEIAAILDPGNSLIRSYLGKAYYEEHRNTFAGQQFELAKSLDPLDPTPSFYDAILKLAENRSIDALRELERSIGLNDNRAVYRSRFLLDEDLAARQVGQARIYSELGFQEVALLAGYRALALNPADYSAHRYLADVYADLPRHEIARVSELLQAQLWQPLTVAALQPQVADDHTFILRGTGPSAAGLNEFDRLFVRNQSTAQIYGLVGGNGTRGDQVIVSTLGDNFSLSAGQFYYKTDGFRENNDLKRKTVNVLGQVEFSPSTSAQIELRSSDNSNGDLTLTFDPDAFTLFHEKIRRDIVRVGGRHMLSSSAGMIASITHERTQDDTELSGTPIFQRESRSNLAEWQFMNQWDKSSVIVGVGRFLSHDDNTVFGSTTNEKPSASVAYVYGNSRFAADSVEVTLGLARERLEAFLDSGTPQQQLSPKFGLVWRPSQATTVRFAAFKSLKRRLIANESIEPTQVAGFNQPYDDLNGTKARRVAAAVDHRWSGDVASGIEISKRDLSVPQGSTDERFDWRERNANAYVSVLLGQGLAATARYEYEQMRRPPDFATGFTSVDTRKVPLSLTWNANRLATLNVVGTYVNQSGQFFDVNGDPFSGRSSFFVTDLGVRFRLGRQGSISVEGRNLFDRKFRFEETNATTATMSRQRLLFARLSLGF